MWKLEYEWCNGPYEISEHLNHIMRIRGEYADLFWSKLFFQEVCLLSTSERWETEDCGNIENAFRTNDHGMQFLV